MAWPPEHNGLISPKSHLELFKREISFRYILDDELTTVEIHFIIDFLIQNRHGYKQQQQHQQHLLLLLSVSCSYEVAISCAKALLTNNNPNIHAISVSLIFIWRTSLCRL